MKEDLKETYLKPQKVEKEGSFLGTTAFGFKEAAKVAGNGLKNISKGMEEKRIRDMKDEKIRLKETLKTRGEKLKLRNQEIHYLKQQKEILKNKKEIVDLEKDLDDVNPEKKSKFNVMGSGQL